MNLNWSYRTETLTTWCKLRFFACVNLDGWPWNNRTLLSFVHHFIAFCRFNPKLSPGYAEIMVKLWIVWPVWLLNLTDDLANIRAPLLCYFKLCASFLTHLWNQTGVTTRSAEKRGQTFLDLCDLNLWLDLDLWHGQHFYHKSFMVIRWEERWEKGVMVGRTDGQYRSYSCFVAKNAFNGF